MCNVFVSCILHGIIYCLDFIGRDYNKYYTLRDNVQIIYNENKLPLVMCVVHVSIVLAFCKRKKGT